MSTLTLVRHGQASFMSDDYDRLSPLGFEQARALGEYGASRGVMFDAAYVGPLRRHAETAQMVREAYEAKGLPFPEIQLLPGLREFHWDALLVYAEEAVHLEEARVGGLARAYRDASNEKKPRIFQLLFEEVCNLWVSEAIAVPEEDRWNAFEARVKNALREIITSSPRGARVVAFTSGGPIAVACQHALDLRPEKALELIWTLRNGAIAEFFFTSGSEGAAQSRQPRFSLSRFNEAPHLADEKMWTYR